MSRFRKEKFLVSISNEYAVIFLFIRLENEHNQKLSYIAPENKYFRSLL